MNLKIITLLNKVFLGVKASRLLMKKQKLQRTNKPNGLINESSIAIVFNKMHLSK